MSTYRFAGLTLSAEFPLPELPRTAGRPLLHVSMAGPTRADARRLWRHAWTMPAGRAWMRVARTRGGHIVQFPGYAEFDVTPGSIVCRRRVGVPMSTVRHLLLDQLLPAVIPSRARLVLHASAVAVGGRAIGLLGAAGVGKSTVAAALVRRGASIVTDDALVIERRGRTLVAVPLYPGLRLWPDSEQLVGAWPARRAPVSHYTPKQRWSGPTVPFCGTELPLSALYVVTPGRTPRTAALTARRSLMAVVRYSMILDATDRAVVRRGFELASRIVGQVPVRRLVVPPGSAGLAAACELIAPAAGAAQR